MNIRLPLARAASSVIERLEQRLVLSVDPLLVGVLDGQVVIESAVANDVRTAIFQMTKSGKVVAGVSGISADTTLRLFRDANSNAIADSGELITTLAIADGTSGQTAPFQLRPGQYLTRIAADDPTDVTLKLTSDFAGSTPATARQAAPGGVIPGRVFHRDFVGTQPADAVDLYTFIQPVNGTCTAVLSDLSANANLELIRDANANGRIDAGETIATGTNSGTADESLVNIPALAGRYFVRVSLAGGGNTNYVLRLGSDTAGNSTAAARNLGQLAARQTISELVSDQDLIDVYRFNLPRAGRAQIDFSGLLAAIKVTVFRVVSGVEQQVSQSQLAAGDPAPQLVSLPQGDSFVRVERVTASTTYTVTFAGDSAGADYADARGLGDLANQTSRTVTENLFSGDVDFYRFTLGSARVVNVLMTGLQANANLDLLIDFIQPGGNTVQPIEVWTSSANAGTDFDQVSASLRPGTYFLRVVPGGNIVTDYTLNITTTPGGAMDDRGGDSAGSPKAVGTLSPTLVEFGDFIGEGDSSDVYRFELGQLSRVRISLDNLTANADLSLFDAPSPSFFPETLIASSVNTGITADLIEVTIPAGTHFVRVASAGAGSFYRLQMRVTEVDGAGNTPQTARDLGTFSGRVIVREDRIGTPDDLDFYKFRITNYSQASVALREMTTVDAILTVSYDRNNDGVFASNEVVGTSDNDGSSDETVSGRFLPGNYQVRIAANIGEGSYRLLMTRTTIADTGPNSLATARNLGTLALGGTLSVSDYVGPDDGFDFYRFTTSTGLELTPSSSTTSARVELVQDKNGNGVVDSGEALTARQSLPPGTYFLRVSPNPTGRAIEYTASVAGTAIDTAGNSLGSAFNLGTLTKTGSGARSFFNDGYVGSDDVSDFWRFSIKGLQGFDVFLRPRQGNLNLTLFRADGSTVGSSTNGGLTADRVGDLPVFDEVYIARVTRATTSVNSVYDLEVRLN